MLGRVPHFASVGPRVRLRSNHVAAEQIRVCAQTTLPALKSSWIHADHNISHRKQIESLMAKLNDSKKNERTLRASLDETTRKCDDWRQKAEEVEQVAKRAQALQNTIDHLENRLEIANVEKLDAQEELFNVQARKSPFDIDPPKLRLSTILERDAKVNNPGRLCALVLCWQTSGMG